MESATIVSKKLSNSETSLHLTPSMSKNGALLDFQNLKPAE